MTFARTKIQPPRPRPAYVERGALEARLSQALRERRAVLLCAPAGYGKTTLLAHALAQLQGGPLLAWVSADAGDDLQRLLECLLAALEPFDPPWRAAPEALVHRVAVSAQEERAVAAEVINALDAIEAPHGVMVIDDLHRVDDPAVFRFLDLLLERMSPKWTLVLASRAEPPLALARLRAADELAEFRQLQLQFARDEARRLAKGAGLDEALADRVFDRTQGWPAGLRIALGALEAGAPGWSNSLDKALRSGERPMFDFLTTEVLDQLPAPLAEFLLRVSVLPELEASRCAAVAQDANAPAMLDEIERLGLFVDVLDAPIWGRVPNPSPKVLRLHDLFREALQQRLERRDPALFAELKRRAARSEPDPIRRITLLIAVGDLEEAARLAMAHVPEMIVRSGPAGPSHVVAQFPAAFRERCGELHFVRGLIGWVQWEFVAMCEHFERAEKAFAAAGDADRETLARAYRATILIAVGRLDEARAAIDSMPAHGMRNDARIIMLHARSWLEVDRGRLRAVAPLVEEMLELLEEEDRLELWYHTSTAIRLPGLPGMHRVLTRHASALLRAGGDEPTPLRALGLLIQAWCAAWRGDLEEARRLRERTREEADWSGNTGAVRNHLLTLGAFTHAMAGERAAAMEEATTRVRASHAGRTAWSEYIVVAFGARIAAACEEREMLRELLGRAATVRAALEAERSPPNSAVEIPLRAQLAWLERRADEAIALWRQALEHEEAIDYFGQASEVRLRLARALEQRGMAAEAAQLRAEVQERSRLEGGPGGALLAEARKPQSSPPLAEELSAREMEVLQRIAAGDSNKVIARALDLSLHTVKRHVANILGKLGVETRGQAAAWLMKRQRQEA